ncbi:hypothetical protein KHD59_002110 [Sesame phyllody phytoplasma]|uniref:Uncharacterized protein n=1 Tax=Sesame phyllody phytoplasma TaxID=420408 RepID=A0ABS9M4T8_9MOLU|nr:hypothetical protein [Sesame phyllody phytoplasma]MCG3566888.1 hypothetical protein [Sesame phyllody phytoplasma]
MKIIKDTIKIHIDFDKRLKTLTEIDREPDESIIKFNQRFKTLTKNDQRQNENDRKQDESTLIRLRTKSRLRYDSQTIDRR